MRKIAEFILVIALALTPFITFAGLGIPFGGLVTVIHQPPNAVCPDVVASPFTIKPVGVSSPSIYSSLLTGPVHVGTITPGAWILGVYHPNPSGCTIESGPSAGPLPTLETNFYGTSIPGI